MSAWQPSERRLQVGGSTLRIATWGQGPAFLLLNGIGGNIEMWEALATRLPGRHLIMVDMPGTGGSPALRRPLRMKGYARLVVEVLDELGIENADVLGYSWGGALAQQLAHTAPSRVRSLVLAATMPGLGGKPPPPWIIALMATPARYYSRTYLKVIAPIVFGSDPAAADTSAEARLRRPPSLAGYCQQLYAISGWSSRSWLRRLEVPVLVLTGSRDPLIPPRNGQILSRSIPGARLRVIQGGHLFLLEQPAEGGQAIGEFLQEQDRVPGAEHSPGWSEN
ncbi:MAG: poly(3-hydroxyalkanoate) depolymerase [Mycobacteriales bacterium]